MADFLGSFFGAFIGSFVFWFFLLAVDEEWVDDELYDEI